VFSSFFDFLKDLANLYTKYKDTSMLTYSANLQELNLNSSKIKTLHNNDAT